MNISSAKYIGKIHKQMNLNNQDYVLVRNFSDEISLAVLADGAGSKNNGGETAEYIIKCVEKYCMDNFEQDDFIDILKSEIYSYVNEKLYNMIEEKNASCEDYGSTMLFVVIYDEKYVVGHIGDGIILYKGIDEFSVLSLPENGKYLNQTYFVPSEENKEHFRLYEGTLEEEFCFILASDGISGTLYNQLDNQISNVCKQMYHWCKSYSEEECNKILEANLIEVFDKYTDDDKSIAIICDCK